MANEKDFDELDRLRRQVDVLHNQLEHATATAVEYGQEVIKLRGDLGRSQLTVDCAITLVRALIMFLPDGMALHPQVGIAQAALDRALAAARPARQD
jgi:hypothetical protein